jgi:hypothetical protein
MQVQKINLGLLGLVTFYYQQLLLVSLEHSLLRKMEACFNAQTM